MQKVLIGKKQYREIEKIIEESGANISNLTEDQLINLEITKLLFKKCFFTREEK